MRTHQENTVFVSLPLEILQEYHSLIILNFQIGGFKANQVKEAKNKVFAGVLFPPAPFFIPEGNAYTEETVAVGQCNIRGK